jgi:hypothetical protein
MQDKDVRQVTENLVFHCGTCHRDASGQLGQRR